MWRSVQPKKHWGLVVFKRIDHIEIIPTDINRTIEFYVSVLGFKIREQFPVSNAPMNEIAYLALIQELL